MKIVITRRIPEIIKQKLDANYTTYMWPEENVPIPYELLLEQVKDADALFTNVSDRIDKNVFQAAPNLKVVSTMAVGYDNIDIGEATARGIPVGHTPDVLSEAVADLTFALLLSTARKVVEAMSFIKADSWRGWGPMLLTGQNVYNSTIGIIGMGGIGKGVAKRAAGFGMRILYHNRRRREDMEQELGVEYSSLDNLLQASDFVVMLAPATLETRKMIGERELSLMKPTAILINTSRGSNIDETALIAALKKRKIWGAGLDVFEVEPIRADHPLIGLENVVLLPHIGSATVATRMEMAELTARHILMGLSGERIRNLVNPEAYKMRG
ncbi:D-glycerate dehydrogenase [Paenibacillus sp. LMG 31456]|uniref:D-glycerate dehydrogenase n=1 Tax=Paenibacillus foliorum TaxID=2654974 RepID=A0A972H066_9BACL|nr:D-glycerate dehydrogenase [Paenibacillus foliorum]NOU97814.1 D-glycerate dehydrogenase [Paenibacillus foliorum]